MSTPLRLVALLALLCAGPAVAQTVPAERAWTDPPARSAATPAPQDVIEAPQATVKSPQAVTEATRGVVRTPPARTAAAGAARSRVEPRTVRRVPKTRVAAEPRRAVTVRALTPTRPGLRSAPPRVVHVQRSFGRPVRAGFLAPPPDGFYGDTPAHRIRQAEAAGYLVVRRSTVTAPDGRLLYGYRPYDSDDAED